MDNKVSLIYYCNVANLDINTSIEKLPKFRQEKALKYVFDKDKKLSIGAWLLLHKTLLKQNIDINEYEIFYGNNGKPYLKNCQYYFSISHSGDVVLIGISTKEIGVDIQEMKENVNEKMINFISNEKDLNFINNGIRKNDQFYMVWTLKEAILKQSGEGITKQLKKVNIDYQNNRFNDLNLFSKNILNNYKVAVATLDERIEIKEEQL